MTRPSEVAASGSDGRGGDSPSESEWPLKVLLFLAAGSGLLGALAFPSPGLWPLSFVAWAPLLVALGRVGPRCGALLGFVAGLVFFGVTLRWLLPLTTWGLLALTAYLATYLALFGAASAVLLARRTTWERAVVPAAWVALEWIRGWLFTGFGWAGLGYALAPEPRMIQAAALAGVPLLSFCVMSANVALAAAWPALRRRAWRAAARPLVCAAALPAALAIHGAVVLSMEVESSGELRVAVVQADVSPLDKWSSDGIYISLKRYVELTQRAVAEGPELVVWPETAVPTPLDEGVGRAVRARGLRRRVEQHWRVPLLFGVTERNPDAPGKFWNSAVLFRPDGARLPHYRKRRLVPFGEYRPSLFSFVPLFVSGPEYVHGRGGPPFEVGGARVGVLICFEDVFPEEAIARADDADFLVVITNDGYFADAGLSQHLDIAVLRAVETGRSIARAANTGISVLIDPRGRIRATAPAGQSFAVGALPISRSRTVFASAPDLFPMLALAALLSALALGWVRGRRLPAEIRD